MTGTDNSENALTPEAQSLIKEMLISGHTVWAIGNSGSVITFRTANHELVFLNRSSPEGWWVHYWVDNGHNRAQTEFASTPEEALRQYIADRRRLERENT